MVAVTYPVNTGVTSSVVVVVVVGVTATTEGSEMPTALVAVTDTKPGPLVMPLIVHEVAVVVVQLWPPTEAVAVYPVMGLPPVLVGAVHEIVAMAFPGVAVTLSGGCGGKIIRETVPSLMFVTHTLDPSGLTTTPRGPEPTAIEVTASVVVLIRETEPPP